MSSPTAFLGRVLHSGGRQACLGIMVHRQVPCTTQVTFSVGSIAPASRTSRRRGTGVPCLLIVTLREPLGGAKRPRVKLLRYSKSFVRLWRASTQGNLLFNIQAVGSLFSHCVIGRDSRCSSYWCPPLDVLRRGGKIACRSWLAKPYLSVARPGKETIVASWPV